MRAFMISIALLLGIALGSAYLLDGIFEQDAGSAFSTSNVRLSGDQAGDE